MDGRSGAASGSLLVDFAFGIDSQDDPSEVATFKTWDLLKDFRDISIWAFPKIRGTLLGAPIMRTIIFSGLYGGPLVLGNYHINQIWNGRAQDEHF